MRLESALIASREGITAHGQALAVIGDNISNVNTTAYKTSRTEFSELLADGTGSRDSEVIRGGNGVQVNTIRRLQENGSLEFTGRQLDVAVAGNGFFMVGDPAAPSYTRAGNFSINSSGILVTADGQPVLGSLTADGTTLSQLDLSKVGSSAKATSTAALVGNLSASESITTLPASSASFKDIARDATNVATVKVFDSLGAPHDVSLYFFKTAVNTYTIQAYVDAGDTGGTIGTPQKLGNDLTLNFDSTGVIPDANKAAASMSLAPAWGNGAAAGAITLDLSAYTQNANASQLDHVTQDGQGTGSVTGYEFRKTGELYANLSSGSSVLVGRIRLANFVNVDGLERTGNNNLTNGPNVGTITQGFPKDAGLGTIEGGSLERSTVDLSNEFVNLIVFQKGYQANSQVLSATSQMLRDTIGLIR